MKRKRVLVATLVAALLLGVLPLAAPAGAMGGGPYADADAWAYAYIVDADAEVSGLKEEGKTNTAVFTVTFGSSAYADADAQSGWGLKTYANAHTYAMADGWAWGYIKDPSGATVYWFDTGIVANEDWNTDSESHWIFPSDAHADSFVTNFQTWTFVTDVYFSEAGQWEFYIGADTLANAFASAGYKVCWPGWCGWKCSGDSDMEEAWDYYFAELLKLIKVRIPPQLPSLKLWLHTDEADDIQLYPGDYLINPWAVDPLGEKPIEWVVPYDENLAGPGAWFDNVQRGVLFIQLWEPGLGHSRDLFGIVVYQSDVTAQEIHLWPYPTGDDPVVQNREALVFATRPAAEAIQSRYEALGRNPYPEELINLINGAVNMSLPQLEAYLAVAVS